MTEKRDDPDLINKVVVTLDICSSSHILEDLLKTSNIKIWRDLLIGFKEYLVSRAERCKAELYKFTGDGWIILFNEPYSGTDIFEFLSDICEEFEKLYINNVYGCLDIPPEIYGLTFGIDEGTLIKLEMNDNVEYIGRAINKGC